MAFKWWCPLPYRSSSVLKGAKYELFLMPILAMFYFFCESEIKVILHYLFFQVQYICSYVKTDSFGVEVFVS